MTGDKVFFPSDYLNSDENVAIDLVTLTQANHNSKTTMFSFVFYDYGSFGLLGYLLSEGEIMFADG